MKDDDFIAAFENGTLPKEAFHHADHVRMAFLYVSRLPILEALRAFSEALRRYALVNGKPNLYHETITWAFLFLIRERVQAQSSQQNSRLPSWGDFAKKNADLLNQKSSIILKGYYTDETFASEMARRIFVLPNRGVTALFRSHPAMGEEG